jgi:hypothetical protein
MFPPRLGTLAQTEQPDDFWPPKATRDPAVHAGANEPAMLLRLVGVIAVIAIIIGAALMSA